MNNRLNFVDDTGDLSKSIGQTFHEEEYQPTAVEEINRGIISLVTRQRQTNSRN